MKIVKSILIAIMICSFMIVTAYAADAPSAPAKSKQVPAASYRTPVNASVAFQGCPPGFQGSGDQNTANFKCLKNHPANPCQPGYTVKWGPCPASDPQCSYTCVADMPSAAAKNNFDKAICAKGSKKTVYAAPCAIYCVDILY